MFRRPSWVQPRVPARWVPTLSAAAPVTVSVPAGSLTLTGYAPTVAATANMTLAVPAAGLTLTGYAPYVIAAAPGVVQVPAATLTLTGYAPTVVAPQTISVPAGSLTLTGYAPTVNAGANVTVAIPAGALTLTGFAPTIATTANVTVAPPAGALTLTGYAPDVLGGTAIPDVVERRRGAGASRFVLARKRLPSAYLIDWLTNEDPSEETKRVIREIKAGRPLPERLDPPKVDKNITPSELAAKLIPRRLVNLSEVLPVQQTQLIRKAARIAQEMDDEEILMLL